MTNTSQRMRTCDAAFSVVRSKSVTHSTAAYMLIADAAREAGERQRAAIRKQCMDDMTACIAEDEALLAAQKKRIMDGHGMDTASESALSARIRNRLAVNRETLDSLCGE